MAPNYGRNVASPSLKKGNACPLHERVEIPGVWKQNEERVPTSGRFLAHSSEKTLHVYYVFSKENATSIFQCSCGFLNVMRSRAVPISNHNSPNLWKDVYSLPKMRERKSKFLSLGPDVLKVLLFNYSKVYVIMNFYEMRNVR